VEAREDVFNGDLFKLAVMAEPSTKYSKLLLKSLRFLLLRIFGQVHGTALHVEVIEQVRDPWRFPSSRCRRFRCSIAANVFRDLFRGRNVEQIAFILVRLRFKRLSGMT